MERRKSETSRRGTLVGVRLTNAERNRLQELAEDRDMTASDVIRMLLSKARLTK